MQPFASDTVADAFARFPDDLRPGLLALRTLIFDTATQTPEAGRIEEALRWGQPAYLTPETKSGTTLRLGLPKTGGFALYVHCQTSLLSDFRHVFGDGFAYEGNRALHFQPDTPLPEAPLRHLIRATLTYHL